MLGIHYIPLYWQTFQLHDDFCFIFFFWKRKSVKTRRHTEKTNYFEHATVVRNTFSIGYTVNSWKNQQWIIRKNENTRFLEILFFLHLLRCCIENDNVVWFECQLCCIIWSKILVFKYVYHYLSVSSTFYSLVRGNFYFSLIFKLMHISSCYVNTYRD